VSVTVANPARQTGHRRGRDVTQVPATAESVKRPRLQRMLAYWHSRRGSRALPARADLDPLDFPWLLGNISLVEVHYDQPVAARRYRIRLAGTLVVQRFGYELTGRWIDEMPEPDYRERLIAQLDMVVRQRGPMVELLDMVIDDHIHDYEVLRLPLGRDGETIDMLLTAADFENPGI
jgi:hypothetical protein